MGNGHRMSGVVKVQGYDVTVFCEDNIVKESTHSRHAL
jgi:hypothetical protein